MGYKESRRKLPAPPPPPPKKKTVKLQELFVVVNPCLRVPSVYETLLCL